MRAHIPNTREAHPWGHASLVRHFAFWHWQPPPHWQLGVQAQRSPQVQRCGGAPAHPHEAFWQRQSF